MKTMRFILVVFLCLFFSGLAQAEYLSLANVRYDAREYPDLYWQRGGAAGHSGAYIQLLAGIVNYSELSKINITAKHLDSDFEATLVELDPSCVGKWPYPQEAEQWFSTRLQPGLWMTGDWEITLKAEPSVKEVRTVRVPRFNFPPVPSGIQISDYMGQTYLAWNSIGAPGVGPERHIEYRLVKSTPPPAACPEETYNIRPGRYPYQLWSGNRIAVPLPGHWMTGDLIRIENRIYDNHQNVYRFDRGVKYFFMR